MDHVHVEHDICYAIKMCDFVKKDGYTIDGVRLEI